MSKFVSVGRLTKTHALRGALKIRPFNFKDNFSLYTKKVFIKKDDSEDFIELLIEKLSVAKDHFIIKFKEINSIDSAEQYRGYELFILKEDIPLEEDEILLDDIIGFDVFYQDKLIGVVESFSDFGAGLLYLVRTKDKKEIFLPDRDDFIDSFDLDNKKIVFKNIEALL